MVIWVSMIFRRPVTEVLRERFAASGSDGFGLGFFRNIRFYFGHLAAMKQGSWVEDIRVVEMVLLFDFSNLPPPHFSGLGLVMLIIVSV